MRSPARAQPPEPARRAYGRRGTTVRCGQRRRAWSENAAGVEEPAAPAAR